MRNKLFVLFVAVALVFGGIYYAFAQESGGAKVQLQGQVETQNSGGEVQVQVQSRNEVQSGNDSEKNSTGTESEMNQKNEIQGQNEIKGENEIEATSSQEGTSSDQEVEKTEPVKMAEQTRSEVANAVQEMLSVADRAGGIGSEIKVIAQAQNENQLKIENSIKNIEGRNGFVKFLIGPDYNEVDNAQKALSQNKEQITQLNQIKAKITNQADQQVLANQISILEKANVNIETSLNQSQGGFSLFGWLFRIVK